MKKLCLLLLLIPLIGCPKTEQNARDAAAALRGLLTTAQTQYQTSCQANSTQTVCQSINRGVSAQNALITATESYCGWSTTAPPPDPMTVCVPVKSAEAALKSATANANQAIAEIRGVIHP